MVSVELHGGVFSSTIFNQLLSPSNQEGLLLGHVELQTKNSISDTDINDQKECLVYVIENTLHFPTPRFFYDKDGQILPEKLESLLNGRPLERVIGWYRSRQHSALEMTMWERSIHYNLCNYLLTRQAENQTNIMFGIFTCESSNYRSTRLQSTRFLVLKDSGKFAPITMNIRNLGNTSSEYKLPVSSEYSTSSQKYRTVCDKYRARLIDEPHQTVHSTKQIDSISNDMCQQLENLCKEVEKSEIERTGLLEEVEDLKKILCLTISESKTLNPDGKDLDDSIGDQEPLTLEPHEEPPGTDGYLIDLKDYSTNQKTADGDPGTDWSVVDNTYKNTDLVHGHSSKSGASGVDDLLLLPSNNLNTTGGLVGDNRDNFVINRSPQNNLTMTADDDYNDVVHSSPPASPVY